MALSRNDRVRIDPELQLAVPRAGLALAPGADGAPCQVIEADTAALQRVIEAAREPREVCEITAALAAQMPEESALQWLEHLLALGWLERIATPAATGARAVGVIGSGLLARSIEARLLDVDGVRPIRVETAGASLDALRAALQAPGLWVVAVEGVSFAEVDALGSLALKLGHGCLFVTYERGAVWVGPVASPGSVGFLAARRSLVQTSAGGPSPEEAESALRSQSAQVVPSDRADRRRRVEEATREVVAEIRRVLDRQESPRLLTSVLAVGDRHQLYSLDPPSPVEPATTDARGLRDFGLEIEVIRARDANLEDRRGGRQGTGLRTVGIIGGGTAGYLTALALRAARPELDVTLIESSKIPVIGVGEATTALLSAFLHGDLGLDIVDFYARVQPTWKLGIRFEWGLPGAHYYNSPFQFGKLLESLVFNGDINDNCLASRLMSDNTTPLVRTEDGGLRSLLGEVPYAYHLDNRRFVRYLGEEARRLGVHYIDAVVSEGVPTADRQAIDHVRMDDGRELRFDLYVDCTGFRSLLMGKALESPFTSYASSLLTDTAVVANVPHGGLVKPYTVAETMDHGWCWNIPMEEDDHRGYVHASAFVGLEQATAEMRSKNPGMGDTWTVKFRSGRHADFWRGNCVAIGNSYAFVEPLQSTAIHMIVVEIQKLLTSLPRETGLARFQPIVSREMAHVWDTLRWFLAAHYRYNRKLDTPFWRECRRSVDVTGVEELIELFRERAPIGATAHQLAELDRSTFGAYRYDLLLLGMGVETRLMVPDDDEATWRRTQAAVRRVAARALPQREALQAMREHPELLRRHVAELGRAG
jgi:tryptophan halogenase